MLGGHHLIKEGEVLEVLRVQLLRQEEPEQLNFGTGLPPEQASNQQVPHDLGDELLALVFLLRPPVQQLDKVVIHLSELIRRDLLEEHVYRLLDPVFCLYGRLRRKLVVFVLTDRHNK